MKKNFLILIAVILPLTIAGFLLWPQLAGTSGSDDDVIGTWEADESTGSTVRYNPRSGDSWFGYASTYIFNKDGSFTRLEDGKADEWGEEGRVLKWKAKANVDPAELDITIFGRDGEEMFMIKGIYKYMNDDKTMMAIQFNKNLHYYSTADTLLKRPHAFDPNTQIILTRK